MPDPASVGSSRATNASFASALDGQLTFNTTGQLLQAALAGHGLAYVPEGMVEAHVAKGRLKRVLMEWCEPYSGYHLYYPSRRQSSAAFALVVDVALSPSEAGLKS
jgi:DNA-binding transcriptional LysR family regulator